MNDNMLFTRNVSLDEKGRMFFIGRYTGVEPGEKLYLFYSEERAFALRCICPDAH